MIGLSKDITEMIGLFVATWLPQSGESIGMGEEEFREDFQPDNFKIELEEIVKKVYIDASICSRDDTYKSIFLKLRKQIGTLVFNEWCRESIHENSQNRA